MNQPTNMWQYMLGLVLLSGWIFWLMMGGGIERSEPETITTVQTGTSFEEHEAEIAEDFSASGDKVGLESALLQGVQTEISLSSEDLRQDGDGALSHIEVLERMYEQTNDMEAADQLALQYAEDHQFDRALEVLDQMGRAGIESDPHWYLYVYFNSSQMRVDDTDEARAVLDSLYQSRRDAMSEDDYRLYQSFLILLDQGVGSFYEAMNTVQDFKYQTLKQGLSQDRALYESQQDVPEYYLTSLVALQLLKHGYYRLSQLVAVQVTLVQEHYILPQQILAYSHFMLNNWEVAREYLRDLLVIDPNNRETYQFMEGVSAYWQGDYQDSVFAMRELLDSDKEADAYRYLFLSYYKLGDTTNMMYTLQKMLEDSALQESDYVLIFESILYEPWLRDDEFYALSVNPVTMRGVLEDCYDKVGEDKVAICQYGQAGWYLAYGQDEKAVQFLLAAADGYPRSYVYQALGDWYFSTEQFQRAKDYYVRAMSLQGDESILERNRQQLVNITKVEAGTGVVSEVVSD